MLKFVNKFIQSSMNIINLFKMFDFSNFFVNKRTTFFYRQIFTNYTNLFTFITSHILHNMLCIIEQSKTKHPKILIEYNANFHLI